MTSKPGAGGFPGISQEATCMWSWRCPAYRRRELGLGFDTEQKNPSPGNRRRRLNAALRGSAPSREERQGVEYQWPGRGTDWPVVAMKGL